MDLNFQCTNPSVWREALSAYESRIASLKKPNLISLDDFYRNELPSLLLERNPNSFLTTSDLSSLMKWKLTRGKWRPRLLDFVSSLDDSVVKSASQKAFQSLPDLSKAISELTVLKGVGPATASAVLAAYAPETAAFMSDEAMEAALGNSNDYSLKQYLLFTDKLQAKAKELSSDGYSFTPSDVERSLWSLAIGAKLSTSQTKPESDIKQSKNKRKRKS